MKRSVVCLLLVAMLLSIIGMIPANAAAPAGFVTASGTGFVKDGKPFYYSGTNCYYPVFMSQTMVDNVMNDAAAMNLKVIRIWAFLDCGTKNADGTFSNNADGIGSKDGCYIQYWDSATKAPAYNTGANGLQKLDYAIYKASQVGLKVLLPFTNNWADFGGMKQYCMWLGSTNKDDFYTNATVKQYYKNYINMLLNRTNSYSGIKYKDDPAIFAWELANEPRCETDSTANTLVNWATEMSAYVKSVDPNHMIDVGDEGFYNVPYNQGENRAGVYHPYYGDDFVRFLKIPTIDFGSMHLYPDGWGTDAAWGVTWIKDHIKDGNAVGKPVVLGEYGIKSSKDTVYQSWLSALSSMNGAGDNYWMIASKMDDGTLYPDYDGFTVYYPSTAATVIANHAAAQNAKTTPVACEPAAFDQLTPENEFYSTPTMPTFTWEPSAGATSYTLELSQDMGFSTVTLSQKNITGTTYTLTTALTPYSGYYWRVFANNAQGTTSARNTRMKFYVGASTATSTPTPSTATATPTPTPSMATVTPTATPSAATATPTPTPSTATATPTPTPSTATATPTPTPSTATATPTPTPSTATATPTPTPSTATATPTPTAGTPVPGGIKVQFFNGNTAATTNTLYPNFKVVNTGTAAINLADVKVRYYFTNDGTQANSFACDYSTIGSGNVTGSFTTIAKTNADRYLEIGFTTAAGTLGAGAGAEVKGRVWKSDWSNFTQTNDYSFNATATNYVDSTIVTGYIAGALKWGIEP